MVEAREEKKPEAGAKAPSVVVVGAGLAGLGAAWRLRRAGFRVAVVERRSEPGGRRRAERVEGFQLERTLDILRTSDAELVSWIRDGGAGDELLPLRPLLLTQAFGHEVKPIDPVRLRGLARVPGVGWRRALKALRLPRLMRRYRPTLATCRVVDPGSPQRVFTPAWPERAAQWDYRSCADFARLYLGEVLYQQYVAPVAAGKTFGDPEELSRVVFQLEYERERLGHPALARRGLSEALRASAEQLEIALRVEATAIQCDERGVSVKIRRAGERERSLRANAVVLAANPATALELLGAAATPAERDFLTGVRMAPTALLAIALERATVGTPQLVRIPPALGSPLQSILIEPGGPDGRAPSGFGVATAVATARFAEAAEGANDEVVEKEMLAAFERIVPRAPVRFTRLARGSAELPCFEVGAYRALDRFRRVQRDLRSGGRRVYFAGDYLAGVGAEETLASGVRAGRQIESDLPLA